MELWRKKMRNRRRELDLTQEELAGRVGVDQTTISDWERGKREPEHWTDFERLSKALEWHPAILMTDIDPDDLDIVRLKKTLNRIPKPERDHYIGLIQSRADTA